MTEIAAASESRTLSILVVDDEPDVLEDMRRSLQREGAEWSVEFSSSPDEALHRVAASPVDVVVSDMRMPGMDGIELLSEIRRISPSTARVILSGDSDRDSAIRSTRVAHQFLPKPCDVRQLRTAIDRISSCRRTVPTPELHAIVGSVDHLPTPGPVHRELTAALQTDYTIQTLENIITADVALTAELLRIVNSSFFGLVRRLERVGDAISFLGHDVLIAVAAARSVFEEDGNSPIDVSELNTHSRAVATLASLATGGSGDRQRSTQAYAAGLLHDVGVLVLAQLDGTASNVDIGDVIAMNDVLVERMAFGADRYSVAEYLLSLWGFEDDIAAAVGALAQPFAMGVRTGLPWTLRIAHEAVASGRIPAATALGADEIELKMALAEIVDEIDVRGEIARPQYAAS